MTRRIEAATVLAASLVLASAAVAEEPPIVEVSFQIEAPKFRTNLARVLPLVETALASEVALQGCHHFGFVHWQPKSSAGGQHVGGQHVDGKLIVTLDSDPGKRTSDVYLTFYAIIGYQRELFHSARNKPIYFASSIFQPTSNRHRLTSDVKENLTTLFENKDFRDLLVSDFLKNIVIANDLIHQEHQERLLVPISEAQLAGRDEETELEARFETLIDARRAGKCYLHLLKMGAEQAKVRTKVTVTDFSYFDPPYPDWHPDIPAALDHKKDGTLEVVVIGYEKEPFPESADGLAMRLEDDLEQCTLDSVPP